MSCKDYLNISLPKARLYLFFRPQNHVDGHTLPACLTGTKDKVGQAIGNRRTPAIIKTLGDDISLVVTMAVLFCPFRSNGYHFISDGRPLVCGVIITAILRTYGWWGTAGLEEMKVQVALLITYSSILGLSGRFTSYDHWKYRKIIENLER